MVARNRQSSEQAYRARALQYLAWLDFPATRQQIVAHLARKNTPMELYEDALALPEQTFASPGEFADAVLEIHGRRPPHAWVSKEIVD